MSDPGPLDDDDDDDASDALVSLHANFEADRAEFVAAMTRDPGFLGDLEVFLSKTLDRYDASIRAKFPFVNQIIASSAAPIPLAPILLSLMLLGVENGGLSIIEAYLDARRKKIEAREHPE